MLDGEGRLVVEDAVGHRLVVVDAERVDEVVPGGLDGGGELLGELPLEQRVDAGAALDERQ